MSLVVFAREPEHFSQVRMSVAPRVEQVRFGADRDRLARQPLSLDRFAASCEQDAVTAS